MFIPTYKTVVTVVTVVTVTASNIEIRPGDGCTGTPLIRPANHVVATLRPWPSSHFWN